MPLRLWQWRFDEGSGAVTGPPGAKAQLHGAVWDRSQGVTALRFDGVDDYVEVDDPSPFNFDVAFSICAWVLPKGAGSSEAGGIIVNKENQYAIARFANGRIEWALANTSPGWIFVDTNYTAPLNESTDLAFTYDGVRAKTYANGAVVHDLPASGRINIVDSEYHPLRIGGRETQCFDGLIRDCRIMQVCSLSTPSVGSPLRDLPMSSQAIVQPRRVIFRRRTKLFS